VDGRTLSAIQLTTAAAICTVLDLLAAGELPQSGFIRQEDIPLKVFLENRFGKVFAKPDGSPHTPADIDRLYRIWTTPGYIAPAGSLLKTNPDTNPVLTFGSDAVELRAPVELNTGAGGSTPRMRTQRWPGPMMWSAAALAPPDTRLGEGILFGAGISGPFVRLLVKALSLPVAIFPW